MEVKAFFLLLKVNRK